MSMPVDDRTPWWLPGGNAQTIWAAKCARRYRSAPPTFTRERWLTPDGDFVDVDWLVRNEDASSSTPLLVLFHGLEGSVHSHYAQAMAQVAQDRGWLFAVPHFRGCSGEDNWAPRAYHSGDHEEVDWMLARFAQSQPGRPLLACGVSLGGNALLRWAEETGETAARTVSGVVAVSAPLDLSAAGAAIDQGWNRWVYARMFLQTMVRKAKAKWAQYPGLFDLSAAVRAKTLREFDDVFTAPLHGFKGVSDYWQRASAKEQLARIRIPTLVLNALNDPFVPASSLPKLGQVGHHVTLWQPAQGGHCGFPVVDKRWQWPGHVQAMPMDVADWLAKSAGMNHG